MTRRIALAFAAVIAALLVLAVVPIGVSMTANEQSSFRYDAQATALQVAAAAEEYLADHRPATGMNAAVGAAASLGDCVAVFQPGGAVVASSGVCAVAMDQDARALAARVLPGRGSVVARDGVWLRVAVPVSQDENAGAVVLARSADPLDDRILAMWGWLCLTGVGALAVGVVLSVRLARWVTRPLDRLDDAAEQWGGGALEVRALVGDGPAEVRRLAATFNQMAERTQSLVGGQQEWVADVSHQLRTPLTALRLRLDVLAQETSEEVSAELAGAQEEIGRLSRLVDGLLAVARAQAAVPSPVAVRADELAAERAAAWEPVARERGISLSLDALEPATAFLGPGDLEQMLDNVLANALEAAADGGRVRIEAAGRRGAGGRNRIVVRVVDDGPGMSEAARRDAFRRYANPGARGNGLGLAIVYRLATANGGDVRLADSPGGGLTVELDLPGA
ncbi:MAG TPA: HAMP domain-containing sensor histidine kinase [Actinocrinis sp.]|nr:HAMP domain-containing sensor histidine kinase [Actinocrinis sp.]